MASLQGGTMNRRMFVALTFALAATLGSLNAQDVFTPQDGVTMPTVVRSVKPVYNAAAMDAGIEGTVLLSAVVQADGAVGAVDVTRSLDKEFGLDEQAVAAMKQWLFKPGTKDGKAVAVRVSVEMTFTLK
jgi:TonB family protein